MTPDKVVRAVEPYLGLASAFCPTLITAAHERFPAGFSAICMTCEQHA